MLALWLPMQSNKYGLSFNSLVRKNMQSVAHNISKYKRKKCAICKINKAKEVKEDDDEMHCGTKRKMESKTQRLANTNKHMLQSSKSC